VPSNGLHHLDLVVSDIERSKRFYRELLQQLGWGEFSDFEGERGETISYLEGPETLIGLREKQSDAHPAPYERYAVGMHHVAFRAGSRAEVDGAWEWVVDQGVETESGPKEFPQYARGYYAAFFFDPDGLKLEVVHQPEAGDG
jgi:glyoxylase I family protein